MSPDESGPRTSRSALQNHLLGDRGHARIHSIQNLRDIWIQAGKIKPGEPEPAPSDQKTMATNPTIAGIVLAGGLGRRMGSADKPLLTLAGRPMVAHVVKRLSPQVAALAISANGDPARFADFGLPVIADAIEGHAGPLAGILAGMRWAMAAVPGARFIVSAAADTPFFPTDLVARLSQACGDDEQTIALAASSGGVHGTFGLWPIALAADLEAFLQAAGAR